MKFFRFIFLSGWLISAFSALLSAAEYDLQRIIEKAADSPAYRKLAEKTISAKSADDAGSLFFFPRVFLKTETGFTRPVGKEIPKRYDSDFGLRLTAEQPLPLNSALQFSLGRSNNYYDSSYSRTDFSLAYALNLYYGMGFWNDYAAVSRSAVRQQLILMQAQLDYQYELIRRFYSMYQAQSILKLEKIGFTLSEKNYSETSNKFKAGIIPEVEMLEMELFLRRKELSLKQAVDNYEEEKADFCLFCNLQDTALVLKHETGRQTEFIVNGRQDLELAQNSSLALLDAQFAVLESETAIGDVYADKSVAGNLNLGLTSSRSSSENKYLLPDANAEVSGRLTLTIPLYQKNEFTNALDYAKTGEKIALDNLEDQKKLLKNDFEVKVREIKLNYANLQIANKNFELAEKIYQISQSRFNNGLITSKDLIQNQIDFFQNEQSMVYAEIDYILSVYRYRKFLGLNLIN